MSEQGALETVFNVVGLLPDDPRHAEFVTVARLTYVLGRSDGIEWSALALAQAQPKRWWRRRAPHEEVLAHFDATVARTLRKLRGEP